MKRLVPYLLGLVVLAYVLPRLVWRVVVVLVVGGFVAATPEPENEKEDND